MAMLILVTEDSLVADSKGCDWENVGEWSEARVRGISGSVPSKHCLREIPALELFHETLYRQDALWKNGSIAKI